MGWSRGPSNTVKGACWFISDLLEDIFLHDLAPSYWCLKKYLNI